MITSRLSCYRTGCGHTECRRANTDYEKNRKRQIAYGRWDPYVDAEPVREHVKWLISQGVPVAKLRPIYEPVCVLVYGAPWRNLAPTQKMRRGSAEALLAVRPTLDMLGDRARMDASGAHRRIEGLCALGWSRAEIARRMRTSAYRMQQVVVEPTVTVQTFRRVVAVYDELSMTRPEGQYADRTRRWAESQGWLPPLCWDDDLIDLPGADLTAELGRRVEQMDLSELARCYRAHHEMGDRSPLIVAGARAYPGRRREARREKTAA